MLSETLLVYGYDCRADVLGDGFLRHIVKHVFSVSALEDRYSEAST